MSRRDLVKKALGITVYPWSSDDELEEVSPTGNENPSREPPSEPRPSVADMPGTSGLQPRGSLHQQQQQQTSPSKRSQDRADRELFWSILNGPPRLGLPAHLSSRSGVLSRVTHTPAAELRERPERSAVADMQRILAIKRLTRNLGSMRRTVTGVIPVPRVNPGTILPSEANSPHRIDRTSSGIQRFYSARIGSSRIVDTRSPGQSRSSRIRREIRPRHNHNVTPMITPVELDDDAMNMSLQSTAAQDVSDEGNPDPEEPSEGEGSSNNLSLDHLSLEAPAPARAGEGPEQLELTEGAGAEPPPPEAGPSSARFDDYRGNNGDKNMVTIDLDMLQPDSPGRSEPANPPVISEQVGRQTTSELNQSNEFETSPQSTSQGVKRKRKDSNDSGAESFTVKDFNQNLLRLLECPVCLEWMEPPISQCRRGHLVCGRCRTRLACCPVCRIAFSSVRNRAMEGVAEMLRYPCRHGCGREVRLRRRAPHEASCLARKYHCPAPLCANGQPLPHAALAQHFQSKHLPLIKIGCKHKFSMKVNLEQHDNWLILAMDQYFHLKIDVDVHTWGVIVYVSFIGPKCDAKNYTYEVTVDGQYNNRKITYARSTHSDLESSSLTVNRQDCFHLTLDQALNFIRNKNRHCTSNKFLDFNVEIARVENATQQDSDS